MSTKIFLLVFAIYMIGCNTKSPKVVPVIHDTIINVVVKKDNFQASMDSIIKVLLIRYYKAGWMDASDGIIDLSNRGKFNDNSVAKLRWKHWREIENIVSKK